jgi:hypothetical protein
LQDAGKDVGHENDAKEFVLELRTRRNVGGVITRILLSTRSGIAYHISNGYQYAGPDEPSIRRQYSFQFLEEIRETSGFREGTGGVCHRCRAGYGSAWTSRVEHVGHVDMERRHVVMSRATPNMQDLERRWWL